MSALLVSIAGAAYADNLEVDGDLLKAGTQAVLDFGDVTCGTTTGRQVAVYVQSNGHGGNNNNNNDNNNGGGQVFANGEVVDITAATTAPLSVSVAAGDVGNITLPSNWETAYGNNTLSPGATATVTLTAGTVAGTFTGSVTYSGTGDNTSGNSITRQVTQSVTWKTVGCKTTTTTTVSCPASVVYTGQPITPCSATVTGANGFSQSLPVSYSANTAVGSVTASATFAGDTTRNGSSGSATFAITKASSITTVSCPASATYTGAPLTPCTAGVTGAGGLSQALTPTYTANTNTGTAGAAATFAGDANHAGSTDSKTFTILGAAASCAVIGFTGDYDGLAHGATGSCTGLNDADVSGGLHLGASFIDVPGGTASWDFALQNYASLSGSAVIAIGPAASSISILCSDVVYDGTAHEPCSATVTGAGGLDKPVTVHYSDNTGAGTATASASYTGDGNHTGSTASTTFGIAKAPSTTDIACTTPHTYTGSPITPCTAKATGAGGLDQAVIPSYSDNTGAGVASVSAVFAGDANHEPSNDTSSFVIDKATSAVELSCLASVVFTGVAQTPCTAKVSAVGVTEFGIDVGYADNTNAGHATATASWGGDDNHVGSSANGGFHIDKAASKISLGCPESVVFTGEPLTPCAATVSGAGLADFGIEVDYAANMYAGDATAAAKWDGDDNHDGSTAEGGFRIEKASSSVALSCTPGAVYTGSALTPCTATVSGAGLTPFTVTVTYARNTDAGQADAAASWAGDANHTSSESSTTFAIARAVSITEVTCPSSKVFTGSAIAPCTATVTGAGGLNRALTVTYADNFYVGTATASAAYAGDGNHDGSDDAGHFTIEKASSLIGLSCTSGAVYTGSALTPCTATVSGAGLSSFTIPVTYSDNTEAGTASISAVWSGDDNHTGATAGATFQIAKAPSTVTVTCPSAPVMATGSPIEPCSAEVTGAGGLQLTLTPTYTDNKLAGNAAKAYAKYDGDANHLPDDDTKTFAIAAWTLNGFFKPVDMGDTVINIVKGGSTVPLKFTAFAGATELTDAAKLGASFAAREIKCDLSDVQSDDLFTTTGGTTLRYDATAHQWIQNWATPKNAGKCYQVTLTTADGTTLKAQFKTK
ncbi:PxKF domain-containing protein [Microbacterium sp. NPDC056057]|uniref:PxKF domain-containing protein n=1 Tax=Microbacterium sp. NPDC056057 TaxID=3345699 RepID=UPI0035DC3E41